MSGNFYLVLGYSLMLTLGALFIYFGYRFLKARIGKKGVSHPYVTLHNLEKGKAAGEIIFYFSVPEKLHVKLDVMNEKDEIIQLLEDKEFEAGEIKIKFDSSRFSNGDYFYRVTTSFQQTVKKFKIINE